MQGATQTKVYFNPTLVQLEWVQVINAGDVAHRFQSHIGAIRIAYLT